MDKPPSRSPKVLIKSEFIKLMAKTAVLARFISLNCRKTPALINKTKIKGKRLIEEISKIIQFNFLYVI